jgi:glycine oxidase
MLAPQKESVSDGVFSRFCLSGRSLFPSYLEELHERTGVAVEWHQDGLLAIPSNAADEQKLKSQAEWQIGAGLRVERLDAREIRRMEPSVASPLSTGFYFPDEAHLDNAQLTQVLCRAAEIGGAEIIQHEPVVSLLVSGSRVEGVRTPHCELRAGVVIVCAGAWSDDVLPTRAGRSRVVPVRGQMIALGKAKEPLRRLVWSQQVYAVPRNTGEILVGATAEHAGYDRRNTAEAVKFLLDGALKLVPGLRDATFLRAWSGLRPGSTDQLPIIGKDERFDSLIYATGHYRNGILLSAITGRLVAELVTSEVCRIPVEFSPGRFRTASGADPQPGESRE